MEVPPTACSGVRWPRQDFVCIRLQAELAEHLAAMNHLVSATPATLVEAVRQLKTTELVPYEKGSPQGIVATIDKIMGFAP